MTYTPIPGGSSLIAGSDHGLLGDLTADDHTQYALLAGRAGGQTLIGGTASGEHLLLNSTAHATKGQIRIGSATMLVVDETTGKIGINTAIDASWHTTIGFTTGNVLALLLTNTSATTAISQRWAAGGGRTLDLRACGSGMAGNTTYGVAQASLMEFVTANVSNIAIATGAGGILNLAFSTSVKYTFASSTFTLSDAVNIAVNTTTGTQIATSAAQKLGVWGVTPVVQPSTTGTTTGFTAGAGSAVLSDSTFTGNTGTKAYTIGDIVLALKQAGLMAAS